MPGTRFQRGAQGSSGAGSGGYPDPRRAEIVAHRANKEAGSEPQPARRPRYGARRPRGHASGSWTLEAIAAPAGSQGVIEARAPLIFDAPGSNLFVPEASPRSCSCSAELEAPAIAGETSAAAKPREPEIRMAERSPSQALRTVRSDSAGEKLLGRFDGGPTWARGMDRYQQFRFATSRSIDYLSTAIRAAALPHQDIVQGLGQPLGGRGRRAPMFLEQTHHSPSGPRAR